MRTIQERLLLNQGEREQARMAGKEVTKMGCPERPQYQQTRADVFLKIRLGTLKPETDFVNAKSQYTQDDNIELTGFKTYSDWFRAALANYD